MDGKLFGIGELYFVALSNGGVAKDLTSKMGLMKVGPRSEATGFRRPTNIEYARLALTAIDRLQRAGWEVSRVWTPGNERADALAKQGARTTLQCKYTRTTRTWLLAAVLQ